MTDDTSKRVTVLLLRDHDGNIYLLDEDAIRSCRATPEQQEAVSQAFAEQQDVSGFVGAGGFNPIGSLNIVVAPQTNINTGLNLAVLSPGATQTLGQVGSNSLFTLR
jgi:hypothetical protein